MSSLYYHHQQHQHEMNTNTKQAQVQTHQAVQAQVQVAPSSNLATAAAEQQQLRAFDNEGKHQHPHPAQSNQLRSVRRKEEEEHHKRAQEQQQQQEQEQQQHRVSHHTHNHHNVHPHEQPPHVVVSEPKHHQVQVQQPQQRIDHSHDEIFDILQSMMGQETSSTSDGTSIGSKWSSSSSSYDIESSFPSTYDVESVHAQQPRRQNVIHGEWRSKICQWLYNVVDHYDMTREIVTISLNYFDRFMASMSSNDGCGAGISISSSNQSDQPMSSDDLALLTSLTVLYVSTKIHISNTIECDSLHRPLHSQSRNRSTYLQYPTLQQLAQMSSQRKTGASSSSNTLGVSSILSMEKILLEKLHWKLHPPTLHSFISLLLKLVELPSQSTTTTNNTTTKQQQHKVIMDELYTTSIFIAELGVCDSFYVDHNIPSSIQAFACICLTMDEMIDVNPTCCSFTKQQRDAYISTVCQRLGLCQSVIHKEMFRESCLRLRALYLEQQEQDDDDEPELEEQQEQVAVMAPPSPSTDDTDDVDSIKTSPYAESTISPPSSPRSTTDMMSLSTMNSAMMAHSLADTITVDDYGCGKSSVSMASVKRSLMGGNNGNNAVDNNGDNAVDDAVVNVTRGSDSMISSIACGVTRGESMVSSMSGGVAAVMARGDSMVASIVDASIIVCGNGTDGGDGCATAPFEDDAYVNDDADDGRPHQSNNNSNTMLRYSPSPPLLDSSSSSQDLIEVIAVPTEQNQNQYQFDRRGHDLDRPINTDRYTHHPPPPPKNEHHYHLSGANINYHHYYNHINTTNNQTSIFRNRALQERTHDKQHCDSHDSNNGDSTTSSHRRAKINQITTAAATTNNKMTCSPIAFQ